MTLTELFPAIHALPRVEKLRLMQFLAAEIARDEAHALPPAEAERAIWSPYDAHEAAATLLQLLNDTRPNGA
ncbi:hypothetical protein [Candidatus Chloroploca sp. Khr17]|uniref:hypothetical protein n=1 Tax=Candidatus Chloroploca sp. Khr17 TaxID=2496869 RepID=UPI00101D1493|nr:hypothetical protein [Candidatus Chloroploca sp. Khr17]